MFQVNMFVAFVRKKIKMCVKKIKKSKTESYKFFQNTQFIFK